MATQLLELLSQPIVDNNRNASQYFEDAWYQLVDALGGEGVDLGADVSALTLRVTANESGISGNSDNIVTIQDAIDAILNSVKSQSLLHAKINKINREMEELKQQSQASLRAKINRIDRRVTALEQS